MDMDHLVQQLDEVSAHYASSNGIDRNGDWFTLKLHEELGELTQAYLMKIGQARSKGLTDRELIDGMADEVADVFAHTLLLAKHHNIDVMKSVEAKWLKHHPSRSKPPL